jgi:SAM-dependent methyltransferase
MQALMRRLARKTLPESIVDRISRRRLLRNVPDFPQAREDAVFADLSSKIDSGRLRRLWLDAPPQFIRSRSAPERYYDRATCLRRNIRLAALLGLHRPPPLRILDLGCGPGWFLAAGMYFGHEATGVDLPDAMMRERDRIVYTEVPRALKCLERIARAPILPFTPLPLDGSYDLITAFQVCFDGQWDGRPWGVKEWAFFLEDIRRLGARSGRFYLQLNANASLHPGLLYYDRPTLDFFSSSGVVRKGRLLMTLS